MKIGSKIDLTGMQFDNLVVIKDSGKRDNNGSILWECECQCKDKTIVIKSSISLQNRKNLSCGCRKRKKETKQIKDLTGLIFGRWKVLYFDIEAYDKGLKNNKYIYRWLCECQCENRTIRSVNHYQLIEGKTKSCECVIIENNKLRKKVNEYKLNEKFGVGITYNTNNEFYFDLEDYDKIKDYCWYENDKGYILSSSIIVGKHIRMHKYILNLKDDVEMEVDHIDTNKRNNMKSNLRIVTHQQNSCNIPLQKDNTSGIKGVSWDNTYEKWRAFLTYKGVRMEKKFKTFEDAVDYRKYLEEKYQGEYAYQEPPSEYLKELKLN